LVKFLLTALLALVLVAFATASSCGNQGGQYREMGDTLGTMSQEGNAPASYAYVGDMTTQQYWPNLPQYVDAIPSANRVYILDAESLKEFKGYKPGPL
jgi:hypothetical protein